MDIYSLIESNDQNIAGIVDHLDALAEGQHYAALSQLNRDQQRTLFNKAASLEPLTLDYFVPQNSLPLQENIFSGRNTLPLLEGGKVFEKRMCKTDDGSDLIFGYNETSYKGWFGPGYFTARQTPDNPQWLQRGGVFIDYFSKPTGPVCPHWPRYRANAWPPQCLFYYQTRDFMRRVSQHVSIGVAYRNDNCLDHYFILVKSKL